MPDRPPVAQIAAALEAEAEALDAPPTPPEVPHA